MQFLRQGGAPPWEIERMQPVLARLRIAQHQAGVVVAQHRPQRSGDGLKQLAGIQACQ